MFYFLLFIEFFFSFSLCTIVRFLIINKSDVQPINRSRKMKKTTSNAQHSSSRGPYDNHY